MFTELVIENIRKIMNDRNLKQSVMASYAGTTPSQFSKIMRGSVQLSLTQLSNIASALSMREIDVITYPKKYVESGMVNDEPMEAILQVRLRKDKKDQVLKLVFGENNIEILNR